MTTEMTTETLRSNIIAQKNNPKFSEIWYQTKKVVGIMWHKQCLNEWWPPFFRLFTLRIVCLILIIGIDVAASYPLNWFMTALSVKDEQLFYHYLMIYVIISCIGAPMTALDNYLNEVTFKKARQGLSLAMIDTYHDKQAFYHILRDTTLDNPGQRLCDDANWFSYGIIFGIIMAIRETCHITAWTIVLIHMQGGLLPYVLIVAGVFTAVSVVALGKPLMRIAFDLSMQSAEFRTGVTRTRDNAETICFYGAEKFEENLSTRRILTLIDSNIKFAFWKSFMALITRFAGYTTDSLPYFMLATLYFTDKIKFGVLSQAAIAFRELFDSLAVIIYQLDDLSKIHAGGKRVCEFFDAIDACHERLHKIPHHEIAVSPRNFTVTPNATQQDPVIRMVQMEEIKHNVIEYNDDLNVFIDIHNLTYVVPERDLLLVQNLNLKLFRNDSLLIVGPSGCGKSSLLRVINGLWKNGSGRIDKIDDRLSMFLPQKPYLPVLPKKENTLKAQLLFPSNRTEINDSDAIDVLNQVNLSYLLDCDGINVNDCADWSKKLSLGEQQRLAFARVLLQQPKLVFLDEATSALDDENQALLYNVLYKENITVVSIAHRMNLVNLHSRILELTGDGGYTVDTSEAYSFRLQS